MDISLLDLLILEPRLTLPNGGLDAAKGFLEVEVSWAVSARTTAPHLPLLRGGELLLVSTRVTDVVGPALPALSREAAHRNVSAIVFERHDPRAEHLDRLEVAAPLLHWTEVLTHDAETSINRLVTESRGNLYRVGSELERQMTDVAVRQVGIAGLVRMASLVSGLPMAVLDARGRTVAAAPDDRLGLESAAVPADSTFLRSSLANGAVLTIGPLRAEQHMVARFFIDRIAAASTAALLRDDARRPRGSRRAAAVAALLAHDQRDSSGQRAGALALGLDPDGMFVVAVTSGGGEAVIARLLGTLGAVQPAGSSNGRRVTLVAVNGRAATVSLASRVAELKRRWCGSVEASEATLALSSPSLGVAGLPRAAREAQFVSTLQAQDTFPCRAASFDSIDDIGAMRLLYHLRESAELRQFVAEALGPLEQRDKRGTLRSTLRQFLESGGSHVDASSRLGIHRNTLAYRLRRIGELVGKDVGDPGSWLTLHLALSASELLAVCSDDR